MLALASPLAGAATLEDALAGALERAGPLGETPLPEASSWLSGVPTLSASYLDSQQALGEDETEFSLNLPIKSAARRRLDSRLETQADRYADASGVYRRWLYAGEVREAAWGHRLAALDLAAARDRRALLAELSERLTRLADSGAVTRYTALITRRSLIDAELAVDEAQRELQREEGIFLELTGLPSVPEDLAEPGPDPATPAWESHPAVRRLEASRAQEASILALSAPANASWNLSLVARELDNPGLTQDQYGIAVELPLNFLGTQSSSNRSQQGAARRDYLIARDQLWLSLRRHWETLQGEARHLVRRRELLAEAAALADRIEAQVTALEASNEIEAELRLQRLLDVLDTRAALARTEALIGRNAARLHQAAGRTP
ncbi:Outer membrane protein [Pseudohaliea rubra DSM 19751]|uniref:Outer membrane protein n=1 Tax=Pseudohaliea rubra DSM 19751 TaxID=1265313 RepID=A0A095VNT7_9GAMM|nr:Outer membrane protein [Pseudohaliea rubra DSM 19751]